MRVLELLVILCSCYCEFVQSASEGSFFLRDPLISHASFTNTNQKSLPAVRMDKNGVLFAADILKQQLASDLKLPLRDLRIVDPSFPSQIQATFAARPNAILFALENIKVVVKHNEAIIFSPRLAEVEEYIPALQQQIQAIRSGSSTDDSNPPRTLSMRFEHIVIEAALNVVCNNLFRKVRALSPAIQKALQGLQAESRGLDIIQTQVDELLPLKNQLDELRKRVQEVDRAIKEVLDNDEDMGMMHLEAATSGVIDSSEVNDLTKGIEEHFDSPQVNSEQLLSSHPVIQPRTEHFEMAEPQRVNSHSRLRPKLAAHRLQTRLSKSHPLSESIHHTHAVLNAQLNTHLQARRQEDATISFEMMLENYLNEIGWVASEVEEMLDQITNTEENVALQIDLLRNRILRFELSLSMSSFIVSFAAFVTGIFGMNLVSGLEKLPYLFWSMTTILVVGMAMSYGNLRSYGKREKLF